MSKTSEEWYEFSKTLIEFVQVSDSNVFKFGETGTIHFGEFLTKRFLDEISEIIGQRCFFKM